MKANEVENFGIRDRCFTVVEKESRKVVCINKNPGSNYRKLCLIQVRPLGCDKFHCSAPGVEDVVVEVDTRSEPESSVGSHALNDCGKISNIQTCSEKANLWITNYINIPDKKFEIIFYRHNFSKSNLKNFLDQKFQKSKIIEAKHENLLFDVGFNCLSNYMILSKQSVDYLNRGIGREGFRHAVA